MNRNLQQLGQKNGTDKHDEIHSFAGKSYLDVYEDHFDSIKESATCILELGVLQGRSLKTWRDFFTNAQIWGIDIDPAANQNYGERISIVTGNQVYKSDLDIYHIVYKNVHTLDDSLHHPMSIQQESIHDMTNFFSKRLTTTYFLNVYVDANFDNMYIYSQLFYLYLF